MPTETATYTDPETGVRITRWTCYRAHSHHLYFTNPGWYDGGRRLVFSSERDNRLNLYSLDLQTGQISPLTDLPVPPADSAQSLFSTSLNPCREEAYFWFGTSLYALDLRSRALRTLAEAPAGFRPGNTNVTADGRMVCTVFQEDLGARVRADMNRGYVGFRETWQARPLCRIVEAPVSGGPLRTLHEDRSWIGHINTSPTQANLLTFCHEGPWHEVDHRIWVLDRATGRTWKIRPTARGECVGHEYWLPDGQTLGYHGWPPEGKTLFFGFVRYDGSDGMEAPFVRRSMHFHSRNRTLIVGDGWTEDPILRLWNYEDGAFGRPRVLCRHRSSFHIQQAHPHPCFSPDGRTILFTSDHLGYCNLHTVEVPPLEQLPLQPPE